MKVVILGDAHWGLKSDSTYMHERFAEFYSKVFFPYIKEHNIKCFIHLGDLVDNRKKIGHSTINAIREHFFEPLSKLIEPENCHFIIGNHDTQFKNTNDSNFQREFCPFYDFQYYDSPKEIYIDKTKVLMLPWICKNNEKETFNLVEKTNALVCVGHLELSGFPHYKGNIARSGLSPSKFDKFIQTFSGHYHTRSHDKNIWYLGTPSDYTWQDYGDPRGFYIWDSDSLELTFIPNPLTIHQEVEYKDTVDVSELDIDNKIVRVVIREEYTPTKLDAFISEVSSRSSSYTIADYTQTKEFIMESDEIKISDTLDIFKKSLNIEDDILLDSIITEIYNEALMVK